MNSNNQRLAVVFRVFRPIFAGVLTGAFSCFLLLIAAAFAASAFDVPQPLVVPLAIVIATLAAFIGAYVGAKIAGQNGWLIGLSVSVILFLISVLAGFGLFGQINGSFILIKALIMAMVGLVGGIVAVNSGTRRKRKR